MMTLKARKFRFKNVGTYFGNSVRNLNQNTKSPRTDGDTLK